MSRNTVYLSGPMTGYPEDNYPAFIAAAERIRAWGWEVVNPAESFGGDRTRPLKDYMRFDTKALLRVDGIALMPGWEQSEGARFELLIAQKLGLTVYDAETMTALLVPSVATILATTEAAVFGQALDIVQPHTRRYLDFTDALVNGAIDDLPEPGEYDIAVVDGTISVDGQLHAPLASRPSSAAESKQDFDGVISGRGYKAAMDDRTKPPVDLIAPTLILGIGRVLGHGMMKHARGQWMKGMSFSGILAAAERHWLAILAGEDVDPDSGELHIYHLACEIMFLSWYMEGPRAAEYARFDDRQFKLGDPRSDAKGAE